MPHIDRLKTGDAIDVPRISLLLIDEMPTAILLPASFVAFAAERFLFPVADRLDAAGINARSSQSVLDCAGALVAQGQVVICRSTLVAMPLNREVHVRMLIEELRVGLNRGLLIGANIGLVVIEIDVLDILREQVFIRYGRGRRWRRWWRLRYGQARRRFLGSAGTFRRQVVGRRIGGRYALRTVRLHGANAIDRNVSGIAGLPS